MPKPNLTMSLAARIVLAFLLAAAPLPAAFALDNAPASVVQELVLFASDEGLARLARSNAKVDFPALANQFEPQSNAAFCGPTSAAIVRSDHPALHTGQHDYERLEERPVFVRLNGRSGSVRGHGMWRPQAAVACLNTHRKTRKLSKKSKI